jgi:hypothetical protein
MYHKWWDGSNWGPSGWEPLGGVFTSPPAAVPGEAATPVPGVQRRLPRLFNPAEPVIFLEGVGRSFKHGGDGRFCPSLLPPEIP